MTLAERFWSRVQTGPGCWIWTGARHGNGYGGIRVAGRKQQAHRVAYILQVGPIPPGLIVRHGCDTPLCVRGDHLVTGTHKDNAHDRDTRGRAAVGDQVPAETRARGEGHGRAKLTEDDVRSIRASGDSLRELSRRYGVAVPVIARAKSGRTWAHVA